ncbi:hypothetical protein [Lentzea sp. NPDC092896]|uniref:hypothetical protein n=1 Tax=Lentzea sp. NPDC092896 TaxID=3364127 RepID=UPI0038112DA5
MIAPAVRYVLAAHAIVIGVGYLLGPSKWYSGGTFAVVKSLGLPIPVWGAAIAVVGVLLLLRLHTIGHALGLGVFVFWGLALGASIFTGDLSGWGSVVHNLLMAAPLHGLGLWRRRLARVRERAELT